MSLIRGSSARVDVGASPSFKIRQLKFGSGVASNVSVRSDNRRSKSSTVDIPSVRTLSLSNGLLR